MPEFDPHDDPARLPARSPSRRARPARALEGTPLARRHARRRACRPLTAAIALALAPPAPRRARCQRSRGRRRGPLS